MISLSSQIICPLLSEKRGSLGDAHLYFGVPSAGSRPVHFALKTGVAAMVSSSPLDRYSSHTGYSNCF